MPENFGGESILDNVGTPRERSAAPGDIDEHLERAWESVARASSRQGPGNTGGPGEPEHGSGPDDLGEAVVLLRAAGDLAADQQPWRLPGLLLDLGCVLTLRYRATGLPEDRDEAIDLLAEHGAADDAVVGQELVFLLLDRVEATGRVEDADDAVAVAEHLVRSAGSEADREVARFGLGLAHAARWYLAEDGASLSAAVDHLRASRGAVDEDTPTRELIGEQLAQLMPPFVLQDVPGRRDLLEEALAELDDARLRAPDGAEPPARRFHRAALLASRYAMLGGGRDDLTTALAAMESLAAEPALPRRLADGARLFVGQLKLISATPLGVPVPPLDGSGTADAQAFKRLVVTPDQTHVERLTAAANAARLQFQEVSPETRAAMAEAGLSPLLIAARVLDPGADPEELVNDLDKALPRADDENTRALIAMLRALVHLRQSEAGVLPPEEAAAAVDLALEQIDPDDPLRALWRDLLGAVRPAVDDPGGRRASDDLDRLRRLLGDFTAQHPMRDQILRRSGSAIMDHFGRSGSTEVVRRLHGLYAEALAEPSPDPVGQGTNNMQFALLSGLRGMIEDDVGLVSSAIANMRAANERLPEGHPARDFLQPILSALLSTRANAGSGLADLEAAKRYLDGADIEDGSPQAKLFRYARLMTKASVLMGDVTNEQTFDEVAELLDEFEADTPDLFPAEMSLSGMKANLAALRETHDLVSGRANEPGPGGPESGPGEPAPGGSGPPPRSRLSAEAAKRVNQGFRNRDVREIDRGIALMGEAFSSDGDSVFARSTKIAGSIGAALMVRYSISGDRRDVSNAIARFEEALRKVRQVPDHPDLADLLSSLGDAHHARGDADRGDPLRAARYGVDALRERAHDVLLESNAELALKRAEDAVDEAVTVARWSLVAGRRDLAVEALELGRGMVLHTVTADRDVPSVLRETGHDALADEWEAESASSRRGLLWDPVEGLPPADFDGLAVPSDLRHRVLAAVAGTSAHTALVRPPDVPEIAAALRAAGAVALVYLLPQDGFHPGAALVVRADGTVEDFRLSGLRADEDGPLGRYEEAQRHRQDTPEGPDPRWARALERLCDWAWSTTAGPLLDRIGGRTPRVVLVPVGRLGIVPWHAARREVEGGHRHACQDAVISYASSARQFVDAGRRERRDWHDSPLVVRVDDSELWWAQQEVECIRDHSYPGCDYLGDPDAGDEHARVRAEDVAVLLPRASVAHLSCHAEHARLAVDSHLLLDDGERFSVRDALRESRFRGDDPTGGLVVLAACASDLTEHAHDEALTLATAFLATGAVGAVGARWPVNDLHTALFMVLFHHYLTHGYPEPAVALRAAQLWMLNPSRRLPAGLDPTLAGAARRPDLGDLHNWAAFTYQGS
ncbi:CHAT domain-containing protein [Actinosynnema sp. NPDC059797]